MMRYLACAALAATLLANGACAPAAANLGRIVPVEKEDLVLEVEVSGALYSLDSDPIAPPSLPDARNFKIVRLAAEGSSVQPGDELVAFDPTDLEKLLKDKESVVKSLTEDVGKTRSENELAALTARKTLEETLVKLAQKKLQADKPANLLAGVELKTALIDRDLTEREVESLRQREQARRQQAEAALAQREARLQLAQKRVAELKAEIAAMSIKARRGGTVIHKQPRWGDKPRVGIAVYRGFAVMEVASLLRIAAHGQVDEEDASQIAPHQRVALRLEAHPEKEYVGEVEQLSSLLEPASPESQLNVLQLDIRLAATDSALMLPGMRFRGRIELQRTPGLLQIPLAAVHSTEHGPVVARLDGGGRPTETPVKLGRRNLTRVEILSGLKPGDRVLLRTAKQEAPARSGSALARGQS